MATAPPLNRQSEARRPFVVRAHHDDETGGWWADSDDIPGLVTEAATYDELVDRVIAVVPEICKANNIAIGAGRAVEIRRERGPSGMDRSELESALSELGERIWTAFHNDDSAVDLLHALVEEKLVLDGVKRADSELTEDAAQAIFDEQDLDNPQVIRPKAFVDPKEWAKNSLYNLALQWVLTQALARMQVQHRFASDIGKHDP